MRTSSQSSLVSELDTPIEFEYYFLAQEMGAAVKAASKFVLRMVAGEILDLWHLITSEYISPALLTFCDGSHFYFHQVIIKAIVLLVYERYMRLE